jgi:hypothetical protein
MDCSDTSANNYKTMPGNIPEEQRPQLHSGGGLKSRIHFAASPNSEFNFRQPQEVKNVLELLWKKRPFYTLHICPIITSMIL